MQRMKNRKKAENEKGGSLYGSLPLCRYVYTLCSARTMMSFCISGVMSTK